MPKVYIFAFIFIFLYIAQFFMAEKCSVYWHNKYIIVFDGSELINLLVYNTIHNI